jgi:hypothetical protein
MHIMKKNKIFLIISIFIIFTLTSIFSQSFNPWPQLNYEMKPWTRWWWMGNAVDEKNIGSLLEQYAQKGFGGVEITPIYGVKGYDSSFIPFLSKTWMQILDYTTHKADSLKMGVDMNAGTGWPFGGPHISLDNAAARVYINKYKITDEHGLPDKILPNKELNNKNATLQALIAYNNKGKILDITDKVSSEGKINWIPQKGDWMLYAAFCDNTLQKVKRAAPGGEGFVLDHFSQTALKHYLSRFDTAFGHSSHGARCLFNDSYEVYYANWTPAFFEEFQQRRGYNLKKYLRELSGEGNSETVARIKCDYRETISNLLLENFTKQWTQWTHQNYMATRSQAHGSPANLLDLYATVDIPEIETFGSTYFPIPGLWYDSLFLRKADHNPLFLKFASSAANVTGKKLISCETFTWLGEHFRVPLSRCKAEVEQVFLAGINHVFYHGTTYSPAEAPWPGWLFYASVNFAPSNSFWSHIDGLNNYISRCQSILQQGKPDNEILVYWPVYDLWQQPDGFEKQISVHDSYTWLNYPQLNELVQKGYSFDFISDRQVREIYTLDGKLYTYPGGTAYDVLYIPECRFLPLETLKKITELAGSGAYVVMHNIPADVPGLFHLQQRRREFNHLIKKLNLQYNGNGIIKAQNINGQMFICEDFQKVLENSGILPERIVEAGLKFIRRKTESGTYYYLVNHTQKTIDTIIPLNVKAEACILMDPQTGEWGKIPFRQEENNIKTRIQLIPGESSFLFAVNRPIFDAPEWKYYKRDSSITIDGPWQLEFRSGGPVIPQKRELKKIELWTNINDETLNSFSGIANYHTSFTITDLTADDYLLVLQNVRESARIFINGSEAGILWSPPFQCKIGHLLKTGENNITIEVANLMANRIRTMDKQGISWKNFYDINFVGINYKPFDASTWSIMPSGIGGPVKLILLKKESIAIK